MHRREFLRVSGAVTLAGFAAAHLSRAVASPVGWAGKGESAGAAQTFASARRFVDLPQGKIAYVERGTGKAALFLHGAPLNGYQWRGALDRLAPYRRCIAPDFMGLGYSQPLEHQPLAAGDQAEMLAALLDKLSVTDVDIVASDCGVATAQLFLLRYPSRVRTMLLTNGDVEPDSPPAKVKPVIEMARAGTLGDATAKWLTDLPLARSTFGKAVYHDPVKLAADTVDYYVTPLVSSPLRIAQYHAFHLALEPNPLAGIEARLRQSKVPVRIVWGASDDIFSQADAHYLDRTFPASQGIRMVAGGKLFFQEEFPDVIAEEARGLWRIS